MSRPPSAPACRRIYVERRYGERPAVGAQAVVASLFEALPFIEANHLQGTNHMTDLGLKHVKIFADGADLESMVALARAARDRRLHDQPHADAQVGVTDYEAFARKVLAVITDRPISFEVFADDSDGMIRQARLIASWAPTSSSKCQSRTPRPTRRPRSSRRSRRMAFSSTSRR